MAKVAARRVMAADERSALTDRELLRRFAADNDQGAFAALVRRHTGLVLGVCRRSLSTAADAEDACQAVFVVLARKAGGRWQPSIANWLYLTARKVSRDARRAAERRARRERSAAVPEVVTPTDRMTGTELLAALDDELDRLTATYREPLVLCYLQGLSREEAAARLGVPAGTVKIRLERGRKKLADALAARGVAAGLGLLALAVTSPAGASPPRFFDSVLAAVNGSPSPAAAALARGVTMNGVLTRSKLLAVAGVLAVGFGLAGVAADPPKSGDKMEKPKAEVKGEPKKADDRPTERTISGTVTGPDGKPIQAELAMRWNEGTVQPLGKTNADGAFKLTVPFHKKDWGGTLVAAAAGCRPDFHLHGHDSLPSSVTPTAELVFKLPKERVIKGRIINQEGKVVAGATVSAFSVHAYDSDASLDTHLKKWAERADGNPLNGDRGMQYPKSVRPPSATTDADGRFELAGFGAGQTVQLKVSGDGIAVKGLVFVNRDGFDAAPLVEAAVRNAGKNHKFNPRWVVCGPDFTAVTEPEKLLRGTVTDHDGKPRAGVKVACTRTTSTELTDHWYWHEATTDKDGRYEIRGLRKYAEYRVEVGGDPASGQLPCQASAKDTVGYEPITVDAQSARGVVVSGRVMNRATGRPVRASVEADVMAGNPFPDKYPTLFESGNNAMRTNTDADGAFRLVVLPGRVVVMVQPFSDYHMEFRPAAPDPDHAALFSPDDGGLKYDSYRRGRGIVQGCWCKVVETKAAGAEVELLVALEPATRAPVKVVDADGKPVTGAVWATGVGVVEYHAPTDFPDAGTLAVVNLETKKDRVLTVIHEKRNLVGTVTLTAETKDPVVKLDRGGTITGRAVGKDGKPLVGLTVAAKFTRRSVEIAFNAPHKDKFPTTDANGEFRVDGLFPGQEFKLYYTRKGRSYGLEVDPTPAYTIAKPGEVRKAGEMVLLIDHE